MWSEVPGLLHQGLAMIEGWGRGWVILDSDFKAQITVHGPNKKVENLAFLSHRLFCVSVLKSITWSEKDWKTRYGYLITSSL